MFRRGQTTAPAPKFQPGVMQCRIAETDNSKYPSVSQVRADSIAVAFEGANGERLGSFPGKHYLNLPEFISDDGEILVARKQDGNEIKPSAIKIRWDEINTFVMSVNKWTFSRLQKEHDAIAEMVENGAFDDARAATLALFGKPGNTFYADVGVRQNSKGYDEMIIVSILSADDYRNRQNAAPPARPGKAAPPARPGKSQTAAPDKGAASSSPPATGNTAPPPEFDDDIPF